MCTIMAVAMNMAVVMMIMIVAAVVTVRMIMALMVVVVNMAMIVRATVAGIRLLSGIRVRWHTIGCAWFDEPRRVAKVPNHLLDRWRGRPLSGERQGLGHRVDRDVRHSADPLHRGFDLPRATRAIHALNFESQPLGH